MPIYDPFEQRMTIRVVYDGVACAGKTTNLRQLCTLFAAQRRGDVETPAEMDGRTLFFDWMQIMAGVVCGFPLLCQIVSVPGQVVLTPRRRHLLASADVVVYVCESSEASVGAASVGLAVYDEVARARGAPIPLVVQANKQDQAGALDGAALLRALGRDGAPVFEAIASEGIGVVDTFVGAVRTAVRAIQSASETTGLEVEVRRAETATEVLTRLADERIDPEWAAEMLLEEAQVAFLLEQATASLDDDASARTAAREAASELSRSAASEPATAAAHATNGAPVLPSADVPTGFIWPAHTGRATVRSLALGDASPGAFDEHGVLTYATHGHVACTSTRARFADREAARQALVRAARECTQLDRLLVPETVLVAQPASDGACWIWTVRPDLPTVATRLRDRDASAALLSSYASAVVDALRTSLHHGFSLDLSPSSFGVQEDAVRYLGELAPEPPTAASLSRSMFAAVEAVERADGDVSAFLEAFERALQRRLTAEERVRAAGPVAATPNAPAPRTAGDRLRAVLARIHEAS